MNGGTTADALAEHPERRRDRGFAEPATTDGAEQA